MNVTVDLDRRVLHDVQTRLGNMSNKAPNVISNALNRAMTNVSANVSKETRKEYNISAADIKQTLSKTRASRASLSAIVGSKGNLIPVDRFKVSPKTVQPRRNRPINIGIRKNGMKKAKGAFVANINGVKVFNRTGKKRLPIKRIMGPSVPQMLNNEDIRNQINQEGFDMFERRLDYEVSRILGRG